MKGYVGVTDKDWFSFLAQQPDIDEVNFWQPGGKTLFRALSLDEPFFFKLHAPNNFIAGVAFFAHSTILPVSLAWNAFQEKNGAGSYLGLRRLIELNRHRGSSFEDYKIGCILLTQPFFFEQKEWIPIPPDFSLNIVQGKTYNLDQGHGLRLWEQVQERLVKIHKPSDTPGGIIDPASGWGSPVLIKPRLGQGSFRIMVTDIYQRQCAITREKTLPALEAAHIKPYKRKGPHRIQNGLLLRADIHKLFDAGYVTVTTDHRFEVSNRIKEEFDNGEQYKIYHGHKIHMPLEPQFKPSLEFLTYHNESVFRG